MPFTEEDKILINNLFNFKVLVAADDAVPAQQITLILLTNWYYTKMAKRKIILFTVLNTKALLSTKNIKIG